MKKVKSAIIFPPLITIKKNSFKDIYNEFPEVRNKFEQASEVLKLDLASHFFSNDLDVINRGVIARTSIVTISSALYEMLATTLPEPTYFMGPSLGQITALHCGGVMGFSEAISIVKKSCQLEEKEFRNKDYGLTFIYNVDIPILEELLEQLKAQGYILEPCVYVTSNQMIVNGDLAGLAKLNNIISEIEGIGIPIPYGPPGHCSLLENVMREFKDFILTCHFKQSRKPVISNVTATEISSATQLKNELITQYTTPVRWYECLQYVWNKGVTKLYLLGPGSFLSKSLKFTDILFEKEPLIYTDKIKEKLSLRRSIGGN